MSPALPRRAVIGELVEHGNFDVSPGGPSAQPVHSVAQQGQIMRTRRAACEQQRADAGGKRLALVPRQVEVVNACPRHRHVQHANSLAQRSRLAGALRARKKE